MEQSTRSRDAEGVPVSQHVDASEELPFGCATESCMPLQHGKPLTTGIAVNIEKGVWSGDQVG